VVLAGEACVHWWSRVAGTLVSDSASGLLAFTTLTSCVLLANQVLQQAEARCAGRWNESNDWHGVTYVVEVGTSRARSRWRTFRVLRGKRPNRGNQLMHSSVHVAAHSTFALFHSASRCGRLPTRALPRHRRRSRCTCCTCCTALSSDVAGGDNRCIHASRLCLRQMACASPCLPIRQAAQVRAPSLVRVPPLQGHK